MLTEPIHRKGEHDSDGISYPIGEITASIEVGLSHFIDRAVKQNSKDDQQAGSQSVGTS